MWSSPVTAKDGLASCSRFSDEGLVCHFAAPEDGRTSSNCRFLVTATAWDEQNLGGRHFTPGGSRKNPWGGLLTPWGGGQNLRGGRFTPEDGEFTPRVDGRIPGLCSAGRFCLCVGRIIFSGKQPRRSSRSRVEAFPHSCRQQAKGDKHNLACHKQHQPFESRVREPVAVQPDAEHVHAEP